jgi:hypothetical protein
MQNQLHVRTDVRAGYRPVHTMVFPDQFGYWVPGWFDLDSLQICGSSAAMGASGGVSGYSAGGSGGAAGAPPPPP